MNTLTDKIALITGAGRGIGRAMALRFAQEGAQVAVVSRTLENAEKVAREIEESGGKAWAFALDVSQPEVIEATIPEILETIGHVDILVNNAGVTRDGLLMRMSIEDWDTVIDTNLRSAFTMIKALSRQFAKRRSGRIINVASVVGLMGNVGQANYAASKAGLFGLTKTVAKELAGRGVTSNAIAPGFIDTDMTDTLPDKVKDEAKSHVPLGRFGAVDDVAHAATFLAGPGGAYITGHILTVDGGMSM